MISGFKPTRKKPPPTAPRTGPKPEKRKPMEKRAPAGGMSLMDELAKKFKNTDAGMHYLTHIYQLLMYRGSYIRR
jgi:hypothetical protein